MALSVNIITKSNEWSINIGLQRKFHKKNFSIIDQFDLFVTISEYRKTGRTQMTEDRIKEINIFIELQFHAKGARGSDSKGRREKRQSACRRPRGENGKARISQTTRKVYKVFISLRDWSSSSLIALYLSFWVYSSSAGRKGREREREAELCRPWKKRREIKD